MCEACGTPEHDNPRSTNGSISRRALLGAAAVGAAFSTLPAGAPAAGATGHRGSADIILYNGQVFPDAHHKWPAQAVAISGNKILAVGSTWQVSRHRGRRTRMWNLRDRVVVPGLIDTHLHQFNSATSRPHVSLLESRSIADVAAAIGARVVETPGGEWVQARSGWHESLLAEGRLPTRHDLDPVSPDNPVYIPRGGHVATVNSLALALGGVTRDTPDPDGGVIVRDANGEPTGVLLERAKNLVSAHLPAGPSADEQRRLLREQMTEHNALGITSLTEPGLSAGQIELYADLWHDHLLTTRGHLLWRASTLQAVEEAIDAFPARAGDDMLRVDGLKYAADGGVEGGFLKEPYEIVPGEQTDPNYRGLMFLPPGGADELVDMYVRAARHGFQVQTHVVGDATFEVIVDAHKRANARTRLASRRFAIMHIFLPTRDGLRSMRKMGVMATVQDHPVLLGHNQLRWWGAERAAYGIPVRDIIDAGIATSAGTDAPVVPPNPFWSLWWMTTRKTLRGDVLGPDQAVTPREALDLYTAGGAYAQFAERKIGTLRPGKLADLVVLDGDPLSKDRDSIKDITVDATIVDGDVVFER